MPKRWRIALLRAALEVALVAACLWLLSATSLRAQTEGEELQAGTFNIDLVVGPVLGAGRIIGLGGAYTALASGVEGASWNPASYASRGHWDTDWMEWDATGSLVPGTIRNSDFDNNGASGFKYDNFLFGSIGAGAQFGGLGMGALLNVQAYDVGNDADLTLLVANYGLGYALWEGQLVLGASARTVNLNITNTSSNEVLVDFGGTAPEAGVLLRIDGQPWRLGFAARMPVESERADTLVAASLNLPRTIRLPWEMQLGFAVQLGPRPLNRAWINPHDVASQLRVEMLARRAERLDDQRRAEALFARMQLSHERAPPTVAMQGQAEEPRDAAFWREEKVTRGAEVRELAAEIAKQKAERERAVRALPRRHLLLSSEAILVGPSPDAVGLESFLLQERQVSGQRATLGLRFGIEGEPIAHWVKMRAGTYFEPSRFQSVTYRTHATLGIDLKLFSWDLFALVDPFTLRLGTSADIAERYMNLGFGVGLWH